MGFCACSKHWLMFLAIVAASLAYVSSYSDNCAGSALCGQVSKNDCIIAFGRYSGGTTYSAYTSRVAGHCTAIYRCSGSYLSLKGSDLKERFRHIYGEQPCGRCGSHAFDNCEVTLNYCGSCRDVN